MKFLIFSLLVLVSSCKSNSPAVNEESSNKTVEMKTAQSSEDQADVSMTSRSIDTNDDQKLPFEKVKKSQSEWKSELSPEAFYILREEGTERPFTSPLLKEKREGVFMCGGCDLELFASETKFKSGTGWPSFYAPINDVNVHTDTDYKLGYARTEVECARCGGHLGHVFKDGPKPTGLRYCINGDAMKFASAKN